MTEFTLKDLVEVLVECAGADEGVDLGGDIAGVAFDELGYDSLALFNTVGRIEQRIGKALPDDVVGEVATPGDLLRAIDEAMRQKV
ncbi:acyl carrier protein [Amycolatopsis sp. NBC_00345]|uniref:acyl carrier protein n=1 Tax=Amycolatopsis sp. NBC_00345 TaxID=2975955 RepID=UPI002E25DBC7